MKRSYSSKRNIIKYILLVFIFILVLSLSSCFNSKYKTIRVDLLDKTPTSISIAGHTEVNVAYAYKVYGAESSEATLVLGTDGNVYSLSNSFDSSYIMEKQWEAKDNIVTINGKEYLILENWKYIYQIKTYKLYERV